MSGIDGARYAPSMDSLGIASDLRSGNAAKERAPGARPLAPGQQHFNSAWRVVVRCLTGLPGIRNVGMVKAWAAEIKLSDDIHQERLDSLVSGLVQRFGVEAKDRALEITKLDKTIPLSARRIKSAHQAAKTHQLREAARDYANHAQLEVWTRQGSKRLGHVGLSVSHAMQQDGKLSTSNKWASANEQTYMSWFPSGKNTVPEKVEGLRNHANKAVAKTVKHVLDFTTELSVPTTSPDYVHDMVYETSERTQEALSSGKFKPKPTQAEVEVPGDIAGETKKTWGTHADSRLAVPLMGDNYSRKTDQTQFAFFGLNERGLRETWQYMTDPKVIDTLVFDTVSTQANCAGRATQLLRGAGAEAFLPLPTASFLQDPNAMDQYGKALMTIVADLNAKAAVVEQTFRPLRSLAFEEEAKEDGDHFIPRAEGPLPAARRLMEGPMESYDENWYQPPKTANVSSLERRIEGKGGAAALVRQIDVLATSDETGNGPLFEALAPLRAALKVCAASDASDFATLTQHTKILVNALHPYATQAIDASTLPYLQRAHAALTTLQAACNGVSRMEQVTLVAEALDSEVPEIVVQALEVEAEVPDGAAAPEIADTAEVQIAPPVAGPPPNRRARAKLAREAREAAQAAQAREAVQANLTNQGA